MERIIKFKVNGCIEKEYNFFYEDASAEQAEEEGYEVEEW